MYEREYVMERPRAKRSFAKTAALVCLAAAVGGFSLGAGSALGSALFSRVDGNSTIMGELANNNGWEAAAVQPVNFSNNAGVAGKSAVDIFRAASDSVVSINVTARTQVFNRMVDRPQAGSGIIFDEDDERIFILTNAHVIAAANAATVSVDDTVQVAAHYMGSCVQSDIAVIYVSKEALQEAGVRHYTVAEFADSDKVQIGEVVLAIGNALGEGKTATKGIISSTAREITIERTPLTMLQTDAAINPGNSGGPLVNDRGQVLGITTAKLSSALVEGTGFAIPSNEAKEIAREIMNLNRDGRTFLGITGQSITEEMLEIYNFPAQGVFVVHVSGDSAAHSAGLMEGDLIVGFRGEKVSTIEELISMILASDIGETVSIYIYRGNQPMQMEATLQNAARNTRF